MNSIFGVPNMSYDSESDTENEIPPKKKKIYRERRVYTNPNDFYQKFRLTPRLFENLLQILGPTIKPLASTNHALSAKEKLMIFLRFAATNEFYHEVCDTQGLFYIFKLSGFYD
jgi:hypothetical protein